MIIASLAPWATLFASLLYGGATYFAHRGLNQTQEAPATSRLATTLGLLAVLAHGLTVGDKLLLSGGMSLGIITMLGLTAFAMSLLIALNQLRRPMNHVAQVVFPSTALILILTLVFPQDAGIRVDISQALMLHIVLSVLAYSLLAVAALQAVYLIWFDRRLKQNLPRAIPFIPIQTLDVFLFESLWIGLSALTLAIATGFVFLDSLAVPGLIHHTILTGLAWCIFVVLLIGRYRLGWRGSLAATWTLTGFLLLALGYFGSKFVVEVVLRS